jgi:hypothetical protein
VTALAAGGGYRNVGGRGGWGGQCSMNFFQQSGRKTYETNSAADLVNNDVSIKVFDGCILYELLVKLYRWSLSFALFTFSEETIPLRDSFLLLGCTTWPGE